MTQRQRLTRIMANNNNNNFTLNKYHDKNEDFSYASSKTVYDYFPHLSRRRHIDPTLSSSKIYTTFSSYRKPRQYSPVYVHRKRELMQMDCIHLLGAKEMNSGFRYMLTCIDCFTKFAWVFPTRNLKCATIISCLRQLFSNHNNIFEKIQSDAGSGMYLLYSK